MIGSTEESEERIDRKRVGEIPILQEAARRLRFRDVLERHISRHGNEIVSAVDTIMLLVYNIARSRQPLYELQEWVASLDPRMFDFDLGANFNDDRFARALDKIYDIDRASAMTEIVLAVVEATGIDTSRFHNDSTTISTFGRLSGRTRDGLFMARGYSKDHRPDLKQLVYSLTICADGAVPVHCKCYPGNKTDDATHIETWETLRGIVGRSDFLYVADCKVCTDAQLSHITSLGGRVVTIIPETWAEVADFKKKLRNGKKKREVIWTRNRPNGREDEIESFSVYCGRHRTTKRGFTIHWIYSSEKRKRDSATRRARMQKAERELADLAGKLNERSLKTEQQITARVDKILDRYNVQGLYHVEIRPVQEQRTRQVGRGRPGKNKVREVYFATIYALAWARRQDRVEEERNVDGVFPLLSTDPKLSAQDALMAYKYQPRLEKRFEQLKSVHDAAPLLFKKVERVEAIMFLFFLALIIQSVLERQVRGKMKADCVESAPVYPEHRRASHPTTAKIIDRFYDVSTYSLLKGDMIERRFSDSLTQPQRELLRLLEIDEGTYWRFVTSAT
jgi:transposase